MKITIDMPETATGATVEVIKPLKDGKPVFHKGFSNPVKLVKIVYAYGK